MWHGRLDGVQAPIHSAYTLNQSNGVPVDVVIQDTLRLLHVDALAKYVGTDKYVDAISPLALFWLRIVTWTERIKNIGSRILLNVGVDAGHAGVRELLGEGLL